MGSCHGNLYEKRQGLVPQLPHRGHSWAKHWRWWHFCECTSKNRETCTAVRKGWETALQQAGQSRRRERREGRGRGAAVGRSGWSRSQKRWEWRWEVEPGRWQEMRRGQGDVVRVLSLFLPPNFNWQENVINFPHVQVVLPFIVTIEWCDWELGGQPAASQGQTTSSLHNFPQQGNVRSWSRNTLSPITGVSKGFSKYNTIRRARKRAKHGTGGRITSSLSTSHGGLLHYQLPLRSVHRGGCWVDTDLGKAELACCRNRLKVTFSFFLILALTTNIVIETACWYSYIFPFPLDSAQLQVHVMILFFKVSTLCAFSIKDEEWDRSSHTLNHPGTIIPAHG